MTTATLDDVVVSIPLDREDANQFVAAVKTVVQGCSKSKGDIAHSPFTGTVCITPIEGGIRFEATDSYKAVVVVWTDPRIRASIGEHPVVVSADDLLSVVPAAKELRVPAGTPSAVSVLHLTLTTGRFAGIGTRTLVGDTGKLRSCSHTDIEFPNILSFFTADAPADEGRSVLYSADRLAAVSKMVATIGKDATVKVLPGDGPMKPTRFVSHVPGLSCEAVLMPMRGE
jgi:hypothetical protein